MSTNSISSTPNSSSLELQDDVEVQDNSPPPARELVSPSLTTVDQEVIEDLELNPDAAELDEDF